VLGAGYGRETAYVSAASACGNAANALDATDTFQISPLADGHHRDQDAVTPPNGRARRWARRDVPDRGGEHGPTQVDGLVLTDTIARR